MTDNADRRIRLADAAIDTLAEAGMRGLTHRAVDQAAGLPEGSCSNHFRTRESLLEAAVDRLADRDAIELALRPPDATDPDEVARLLTDLVTKWTTVDRTRMLARYELALESTRRPKLRRALRDSGLRFRAMAADLLAGLGADEPQVRAHAFIACLDGLIFDRLAGAGEPDTQQIYEALRILLRGYLS
ncbi:TetR/AcrR family transcriptional regulator [Nocardia aurantiaca]|uniref:TetR/AcrR family transcriptional regulator n=1 Tax=Nocardia aurantiaca TaxID=2675850 RepID=UPI0018AB070F|nr:TetR/AcrR family transcriptional regulator [Nocardia aurantiaca]